MIGTENKKWLMLTITSEESILEILDAHLQKYYLGMMKNEDNWSFYFEVSIKDKVENLITEFSQQFKFTSTQVTIKSEPRHLAWQDNFQLIRVSDEMIVIPDWDKKEYSEKVVIKIRPGMAFGTGHHFTTKLMLKALSNMLDIGDSVLDIGTGSGILAIASSKLGARKVDAVENDHVCKENFTENLLLNNIHNSVELFVSDALEWKDYSQNLILANINRNVIMKLIPKMINSKGMIVLSGLLESDEKMVIDQCKKYNFDIIEILRDDEWICLVIIQKEQI
ncbi:MAG: 50S ribosomal protein L11 methyltransferase [Candidatus Marinimicrobia bacterium]|nr:50S ribosomal protein L11 methyltransferase [Candidatus Neomarinimicrobiota bacterium]MBL7023564.1 50S ribosomal protein L11 methyltransferase [Candidatus Neomarinimicrobiota bacterium]MBL7109855.1 50S ribosomal protein L11 methyltransferase [Candidatus Neomarinimicrobiota bacterium]